jgi:hypothetical protein
VRAGPRRLPVEAVDRLRRARWHLERGEAVPHDLARWLLDGLAAVEIGDDVGRALGAVFEDGWTGPQARETLRQRDEALLRLCDAIDPDRTRSHAAIAREAARRLARGPSASCPLIRRVHELGAVGERRIRQVLRDRGAPS